jgi:hypothetical protein
MTVPPSSRSRSEEQEESQKRLFSALDEDGSGQINKDELRVAMEKEGWDWGCNLGGQRGHCGTWRWPWRFLPAAFEFAHNLQYAAY